MTMHLAYQQLSAQLCAIYDDREAANIASLLIEHITGQTKIERILNKECLLTKPQEEKIVTYTEQLLQHRPIQYVLNEAWFVNMKLYVDERVLIPRPETEELVDWIVRDVRAQPRRAGNICLLDIGTGSGCIPIAIKKQLPAHLLSAVDISDEALEVAKRNAAAQQVKIDFYPIDFLNKKDWNKLESFDVIISNPPYIKKSEEASMADNVSQYEPHIALFVPDENALIFYRAIAEFAKGHLVEKGSIYVEINEALGAQVIEMFRQYGFEHTELRKDLQGRDRMIKAQRRLN